jgi:transcriptional regulator with XRE-family HTH domain
MMSNILKGTAKKAPHPIDKHVGSRVRMRRMMLAMSQEKLGDALGLTFQQVQKYEKGINRISASRLQQISHILQVPVESFFEEAPNLRGTAPKETGKAPSPAYLTDFLASPDGLRCGSKDFLASPDGLRLAKAFMRIERTRLRRSIGRKLGESRRSVPRWTGSTMARVVVKDQLEG